MNKKMRLVNFEISLLVGGILSFSLSLIGNLTSGQFEVHAWLTGFLVSLVISVVVGLLVPMPRISMLMHKKFQKTPFVGYLLETLISDLIYTPVICYLMVLLAWFRSGRHFPFAIGFFRSLGVTFVAGYVLIFVLVPLIKRLIFHLNGVDYLMVYKGGREKEKEEKENDGNGSKEG